MTFRLPLPSVSRNRSPSFPFFLRFLFSTFIFICKVRFASPGSTTCFTNSSYLSLQPQFSGPLPPVSHKPLLCLCFTYSLSTSSCCDPAQAASSQLRMEPSRSPTTAAKIWLSPPRPLQAVADYNCSGPLKPTVRFSVELTYHDTICLALELL